MCERLLQLVDGFGADIPITLLVVPQMHRREPIDVSTEWRRVVDRLLSRGCEIALHGMWHLDDGGPSPSIRAFVARHLLTAGEAEFAALDQADARRRIELGLTLLHRCGWQARGFVPPAWQISAPARSVLASFRFQYTTDLRSITHLPTGARANVPCLVFSARSALRRAVSTQWMTRRLAQLDAAPALRIALHPIDARYDSTLATWRRLLETVLRDHYPVTKSELCRALATSTAAHDAA